ncbi:FAD-binding oxidoreductase [uncultured Streptomyces sp.]|uniref:FAD-binding oxidoreductase n=1 Tax=uncultured Streptomyces sp. TaxID=174707 RepID=UPI00260C4CF0|nr:FAD-binding oxidoreductase [uncultured Streptomyces sp.]
MSVDTVSLTGRGRTSPTTALRFRPRSGAEAAAFVRGRGPRGALARGLGSAHGDAAQNAGGSVLDMTALRRIRSVDRDTGTVVCEAGVPLDRLAATMLPLGWYLPVTPGTPRATVGGAIATDAHGRDHPAAGSFSRHVIALELLTADGTVRTLSPGEPLFDATAGGLGLTGVVLSATVRCRRVGTSLMTVDTARAGGLDGALALLERCAPAQYAAAWIDLTATGRVLGRGLVRRGEHAPPTALPARARRTPLDPGPGLPATGTGLPLLPAVPAFAPRRLLARTAVGLLNEVRHRAEPRSRSGGLQRLSAFFAPLDGLPGGATVPGRGATVRYRFALGHGQEETLRQVVRRLASRHCPASAGVLERLGAAGAGWLSFPLPGWSLSVELPARAPGLAGLLDALDDEVAAAGGRVALCDDARVRPATLAAMYPRLAEFRALRATQDPTGALCSDLSRRLGL